MKITTEDIVRFKGKYQEQSNGCYEWQAALNENGYGEFRVDGGRKKAHRVAYTIFKGEIPEGLLVCHSCDNKKCVNPAHLWLGTDKDNAVDRNTKNRQNKGSLVNHAKLTEEDVISIKIRLKSGQTQRSLAREYGVHHLTIHWIKQGKTWTHVKVE